MKRRSKALECISVARSMMEVVVLEPEQDEEDMVVLDSVVELWWWLMAMAQKGLHSFLSRHKSIS